VLFATAAAERVAAGIQLAQSRHLHFDVRGGAVVARQSHRHLSRLALDPDGHAGCRNCFVGRRAVAGVTAAAAGGHEGVVQQRARPPGEAQGEGGAAVSRVAFRHGEPAAASVGGISVEHDELRAAPQVEGFAVALRSEAPSSLWPHGDVQLDGGARARGALACGIAAAPTPIAELHVELDGACGHVEHVGADAEAPSLLEDHRLDLEPRRADERRFECHRRDVEALVCGRQGLAEAETLRGEGFEGVLFATAAAERVAAGIQLAQGRHLHFDVRGGAVVARQGHRHLSRLALDPDGHAGCRDGFVGDRLATENEEQDDRRGLAHGCKRFRVAQLAEWKLPTPEGQIEMAPWTEKV